MVRGNRQIEADLILHELLNCNLTSAAGTGERARKKGRERERWGEEGKPQYGSIRQNIGTSNRLFVEGHNNLQYSKDQYVQNLMPLYLVQD